MNTQSSTEGKPKTFEVSRTTKIAATGLFAALSVLLTSLSQALGLNFPIIPYLQFDFGEIAILLAFLMLGPLPATASAFVEFLTLMILGQNVPIGPIFKILAILSSIGGIWVGMYLTARFSKKPKKIALLGSGLGMGLVFRVLVMSIPNYYLIVFVFTVSGTTAFLSSFFKIAGVTLTQSNALGVILGFTALFNCLQLILVVAISYLLVGMPQLRRSVRSKRMAWFESVGGKIGPE